MPTLFKLLEKNRQWAEDIAKNDPTYFPQLAAQQVRLNFLYPFPQSVKHYC